MKQLLQLCRVFLAAIRRHFLLHIRRNISNINDDESCLRYGVTMQKNENTLKEHKEGEKTTVLILYFPSHYMDVT